MNNRVIRTVMTAGLLTMSIWSLAGVKHQKAKRAPKGRTKIETVTQYTGNYHTSGLETTEPAPDVTFYTQDDRAITLHELLGNHMPILLVSGSYTCPHFRKHSEDVNEIAQYYKGKLQVYVVYIVEAHPEDAICPYIDSNYFGLQNAMDDIRYPQAKRYRQRKAMAEIAKDSLDLQVPVLIDGPDNKWWKTYGPAPNSAYLVDTSGIIKGNNHQLNGQGENMWCYIDSYLGTNSGKCK